MFPADRSNAQSARSFQCRDALWEIFERLARDTGKDVDALVNDAMDEYARPRRRISVPSMSGVSLDDDMGVSKTAPAPPLITPSSTPGDRGTRPPSPSPPSRRSAPPPLPRRSSPPPLPVERPHSAAPAPTAPAPTAPAPTAPAPTAPPPPTAIAEAQTARPAASAPAYVPPMQAPSPPNPIGTQPYDAQSYASHQSAPGPIAPQAVAGQFTVPQSPQAQATPSGSPLGPPQFPVPAAQAAPFPPGSAAAGAPPPPAPYHAATHQPPMPPPVSGNHAATPLPGVAGGGVIPYGGPRPMLLANYGGHEVPVNKDRFIIGRGSKSSDLTIKDANISRQHAMVEYVDRGAEAGSYFMVDMGSTNGVDHNGQRVSRKRIDTGDVFDICGHQVSFRFS